MPWVQFERTFIWNPIKSVSIMYKAGGIHLVTTPCAEEAIKKGAGKRTVRPTNANNSKKSEQIKQESS